MSAHRPTFDHAKGRKRQRGAITHDRELTSHTKIKFRTGSVKEEGEFSDSDDDESASNSKIDRINNITREDKNEREEEQEQEEEEDSEENDSDDEEMLLQELELLKGKSQEDTIESQLLLPMPVSDNTLETETNISENTNTSGKSLWRNNKRRKTVKKASSIGNDTLKGDSHRKFMDKYIK
ncbi:hypothetical protein DAMA08_029550 [Martiniozyma asiatica (nom. inval.)]|nr:hypothetical protein DAMA08_029550 [Martiniozyma asiatica]